MEKLSIPLNRSHPMRLSCTFVPSQPQPQIPKSSLIVYLTGIDNPQTIFYPTISSLLAIRPESPPMLAYDRPGLGASKDRYPDIPGRPKQHGRDCLGAAHDLHDLIAKVAPMKLGVPIEKLKVIMIAHSLGCAIARLYADAYPGTVSALLLLDSTLANSDTISVFPDPKTPGFDERELPKGITAAMCSDTRRKFQVGYAADSPNKEGIWRGTLPALLPLADEPKLMGPGGRRPYVTVIRNDPVVYVMAMEKILKVPSIMSEKYFDPYWQSYSEGLTKLTDSARSRGPIVAKGLGHMLIKEKGGPEFVAEQICELLDTMSQDEASKI